MVFHRFLLKIFIIIMLCFVCQSCFVQDDIIPTVSSPFIKYFGGIKDQQGFDLKQTSDGGFIVLGSTTSFGNGGSDLYLIKVDIFGNEQWSVTYGGLYNDYGRSIQITADNGYALVGDFGYADNSSDLYFLKVDSQGIVQFEFKYGNNNTTSDEHGYEVKTTMDGGFILVGSTSKPDKPENGPTDFYLVKTDINGLMEWERTRGFENSEEIGKSVAQIDQNHYIVIGTTENAKENDQQDGRNIFAYKININGDNIANRFYGGMGEDIGNKICKTTFGYAIIGTSDSQLGNGAGGKDMILIQIDNNLNDFSTRTFGGPLDETGNSVTQLVDGSFLMVGTTTSFSQGSDNTDIYLLKTDFSGNELEDWLSTPRVFGGEGDDVGQAVIETSYGFVLVGTTSFFEATQNRVMNLIKTNPQGKLLK